MNKNVINKYLCEGIPPEKLVKIRIELRDPDESMIKFLDEIQRRANVGHSFSVEIDMDSDEPAKVYFDGDGSFYIQNIEVEK